jgi:hypothetical protein
METGEGETGDWERGNGKEGKGGRKGGRVRENKDWEGVKKYCIYSNRKCKP